MQAYRLLPASSTLKWGLSDVPVFRVPDKTSDICIYGSSSYLSPSNVYVLSNLDRMDVPVHALDFCSLFLLLLLNFKENSCQYGSSLNLQNAGMKTE